MKARELLIWLAVALGAAVAIALLLPRAFPLLPRGWQTDAGEARAIALERMPELGPLPNKPLVVVSWRGDGRLEHAVLQAGREVGERFAGSRLADGMYGWTVTVYDPASPAGQWSHQARVSRTGVLTALRRQLPKDAAASPIAPDEAATRAAELLGSAGVDLATLGPPETRQEQLARRTDLVLRYPARHQLLGGGYRHGVQVHFLGDQPGGFDEWLDEPQPGAFERLLSPYILTAFSSSIALFLLILVLGVLFVRKYHHGEVGVRRLVQIFLVVLLGGLGYFATYTLPLSEGVMVGALSRQLTALVMLLVRSAFSAVPLALLGALAWAVGESWARERWGAKLAAFDALFQAQWGNATVARSSLRGVALGLALVVAMLTLVLPLQKVGGWPLFSMMIDPGIGGSGWRGIGQVVRLLGFELPTFLLACLFFSTLVAQRLRGVGGALLAGLAAILVVQPPFMPLPVTCGVPLWLLAAAVPVLVFWATDLLTALLCGMVAWALLPALPLLLAANPGMQVQGWIPLVVLLLPLVFSVRHLLGGREFVYRWEDVPLHVRRIAERERQRVELETARQIQSSILPELPPQLAGVALAHAYLPASEVGGDFYDVLELEDGRLAIAVGDVAGHGVSSGLVMSMVRSALAVQVTFDPRVESVFGTLNRMVFQSARRRLLTTLTYAIIDPLQRELVYASAGHIFPLRVTAAGEVWELEAGAYPLGVRADLQPVVRQERLAAGDTVVLLSDGIVEACREGSDEPFGFARLQRSLSSHAGGSPEAMVRGVLADLAAFTRHAPREDDVTLLAARIPS